MNERPGTWTDCGDALERKASRPFFRLAFAVVCALACAGQLLQAADIPPTASPGYQAEYKLGPEDVIEVFVYKEAELSTTVTVRPDGRISLPLAGELDASGKSAVQMQEEIAER